MAVTFAGNPGRASRPVHLIARNGLSEAGLPAEARRWAEAAGFKGEAGSLLLVPGRDGDLGGALYGLGEKDGFFAPLATGKLARLLPEGDWHFAEPPENARLALLGLALGGYAFTRYGKPAGRDIRFAVPEGVDAEAVAREVRAVFLARDLINTPASDMGPEALEKAVREIARPHHASVRVTRGEALLKANLPMIHAVGRAAGEAPRLVDLRWGSREAPRVSLVGKGVCFDTGGLDIKPSNAMLLMKKDMGGAANVLALADMIMSANLPVRLRVLIPAVENAISGTSFRPGDVLRSRKGLCVEIGNTDAEGRLVLADALALADEEEPEILVDMATLTGAARVALGADVVPFFTNDEMLAEGLLDASRKQADPLWRMPLWRDYAGKLDSRVADLNNVASDSFAGCVIAALFLQRFVEKAASWMHFDLYAWNPVERPHAPVGGEAQAIRALFHLIAARYGG
jgi:leucyl aminopeptidase